MAQIRIDMRSYRWIGFICLGCFAACAILAAITGQFAPSLAFAIFSFLGLYMALSSGVYAVDEETFLHNSPLGLHKISWKEISAAQYSQMGSLVLLGGVKRFVVAPPSWWSGTVRAEGLRFISEQLKTHGIALTPSGTADYKWMKNTKVKR